MYSNLNVWKDDTTKADKGAGADLHERVIIQNPGSDFLRVMYIFKRMGYVNDRAVSRDGYIATDSHSAVANDVHVLFDVRVVSDCQLRDPIRIRPYDFQSDAVSYRNFVPYANEVWVYDQDRPANPRPFAELLEDQFVYKNPFDLVAQCADRVQFVVKGRMPKSFNPFAH